MLARIIVVGIVAVVGFAAGNIGWVMLSYSLGGTFVNPADAAVLSPIVGLLTAGLLITKGVNG